VGAAGVVPGLCNVDPAACVQIRDGVSAGDLGSVGTTHRRSLGLSMLLRIGSRPSSGFDSAAYGAIKSAMVARGMIDRATTARPQVGLTDDDHSAIEALLRALGLSTSRPT